MKTRFTLIGLLLAAGALHAQTWNGATSDDWFTSTNWTPNTVPGSSSSVTIPGSLSTYPKLSGNVSIAALTMQSGSSLNLNGNTLASAGNLSIVSAAISGGGSFSSTGAGSVTVQGATITAAVSITGYTGAAHIYDNSITGNTTISNASSQSGDNYIDGNTFTGNLTLTHNSNNSSLSEGYASPSSQANVITGNAIFNQAASTAFYSSYSRPTQFGGNLTISHTGSGLLSMFRNSASVGGDLSLTSSSGAGRDELNYSLAATVNVAGKVDLSIASGASFEMNKIKGATSGGSVSVTSPTTVEMSSDTLKSNVSIAAYTGFAHIYDNDITGNVLFSNTAGQSGDNNIDGNNISGTFSLTQASNNNVMDEGYASPTAHANKIGGNTTLYLTGVKALHSSYSRPTQFGGNLSISHTGSGLLSMFISSGSVGGDLSLTSSGSAGKDELNPSSAATVNVSGKVNISVVTGAPFEMNKIRNATAGGSVTVSGPTSIQITSDTLKSNLSVTSYTGSAHVYDNDITGDVVLSNTSGQSGDNYIDGNNISGTLSLTQASNNNEMDEGYGSPSGNANKIGGNTTISLTGVRTLYTSYSRPSQFGGNLTVSHTGSGMLSAFVNSASVSGNLSVTSGSGAGRVELNPTPSATVNVGGKVDVSINSGASFEMNRIKGATSGGTVSVAGPTSVEFAYDTLKSDVSITNYTGFAHVYDNNITGNMALSNTAGQSGDNYVDGSNVSGTFSLTQASNNSDMDEGFGSPSGNANKIGGNTTMSLTGVKALYTSYSRPSQFGGNLTVSHTGSGLLSMFLNSGSVGGNFSLTSSAGSDLMNTSYQPVVRVGGTVNAAVTSGGSFVMQRISNATPGGAISVSAPASTVGFRGDTLKADVTVSNYTGAATYYDNDISGNVSISNANGQAGDNYVDGNRISGNLSLTQASNNSTMYEGTGSPTGNVNMIGGNTTILLTGGAAFLSSYSRPSQFTGNLTLTHTGGGQLSMFRTSGSVGGNLSLTSTAGAGGDQLNPSDVAKVVVAGKVDASVASGASFEMNGITGLTSGGALSVASPGYVNFRHDTLKSDVSLTNYLGQIFFFDNSIVGNVALSNTSAQSGVNYIDGNQIDGNFSLTHASNNSAMSEGYGSPSGNGNHVTGNTAFYHTGVTAFISDYSHNGSYDGDFAVQHDGSGDMTLFATTGSVGGNFTLVGTAGAGANSLNPSGSDVVDIGGKVRIMTSAPKNFTMNYLRSSVGGDTIAISGGAGLSISNDTLSAVMRLTGFTSSMTLYNNRITGPTLVADAASQSGSYYLDGNHFNGDFSLVHATTNAVYEGYAATLGDVVSGVDSVVNLSTGAINIGYSHSHHAAGTFIMNAGSGINFGSNAFIFDGPSTGAVRNYGAQQIVIPNVTLAKTGGAMVNLQAPVSISNSMNFTSGYMAGSSGSPLVFTSGGGYSNASDASHALGTVIKVGSSAFTFPTGDGIHYFPCGISAPASATDSFFAEYKNQSPSSAGYTPSQKDASINHVSNAQYWLISRAASTSSNVKVTLGFNSTSGVNNLSDLVVAHWYDPGTGAKWVNEGNGGITGTTSLGTITSNNTITTFSPFTLGSTSSNNPLPITLTAFTATAVGQTALLNWHSGVEMNVLRFDVQRSSDGQAFATLGSVAPQGSGHAYDFTDPAPTEGLNLYRLAVAEADGSISYSTVQALRFGTQEGIAEIVLYPNPASESLFVDGLAAHAGAVLSIRNITGQLLHQQLVSGQSRVEISLRDLPAGAYLLNVDDDNGSVYRGRFLRR